MIGFQQWRWAQNPNPHMFPPKQRDAASGFSRNVAVLKAGDLRCMKSAIGCSPMNDNRSCLAQQDIGTSHEDPSYVLHLNLVEAWALCRAIPPRVG
eukprot:1608267-Amphidinium_carterae.1